MYADDSALYKSDIEDNKVTPLIQLQNCISQISASMNISKIKTEEDKML